MVQSQFSTSSYDDPCPRSFNLAGYVLAASGQHDNKCALVLAAADGHDQTWSFGALRAQVYGVAAGLRATGAQPGARLLMRLDNTANFPITFLGAIAAGLVPIAASSMLTPPEIANIIDETAPALIVASAHLALPSVHVPVINETALAEMKQLPSQQRAEMGAPERPAYIVYTSGTSGQPRAVVHAHRAIWARRMMWQGWYGLVENDRVLHAGAFNWTYTLGTGLMDPWAIGATALIAQPGTPPEALPGLLDRHKATIFAAAPGVYRKMLRGPVPKLPQLRHGLSAGEKLSDNLRSRWQAATGTALHEAYGLSECSTFLSGAPDRPAPKDTLGYPQPGRRMALIEGGVPANEGIIAVHRSDPGLMLGYLGRPAETEAKFSGDWFLTGDRGLVLPDGAIKYLGRADDMMNAGGYRVAPLEIEEALCQHPGVEESAAVELNVKTDASIIAVFWVGPENLTKTELGAFLAQRLARYKCPRLFTRIDALPRGANNKVQRRQLKEKWEAENGPA